MSASNRASYTNLAGKTIVNVYTEPFQVREGDTKTDDMLLSLHFDDGSQLVLLACESDWEPYVSGIFIAKEKK
jgi:hypothetical protein